MLLFSNLTALTNIILFFSQLKKIQLLRPSNTTFNYFYSQTFKLRDNMTLVFVTIGGHQAKKSVKAMKD